MTARRDFLTTLFAALEANGVRYCVLRNYDQLFTDTASDVDLLVSPYSRARFIRCLRETARQTGFRFVQAARFVNDSHVYWHPSEDFVRVDFETGQRWRVFPILTARDVLDARQPHAAGFFIPHPKHESVILFVAALWRGRLSDRYREQLTRLYAAANAEEWRPTFCAAFGAAGDALVEFQSRLPADAFDRALCARTRRSLMRNVLSRRRFGALICYIVSDAVRLVQRFCRPPGIALIVASSASRPPEFDTLMRRLDFLCPAASSNALTADLAFLGPVRARRPPRLRWRRLWVLFRGGLFARGCRVARDADLLPVIRNQARGLHADRTFICVEDSAGRHYFGHAGTGLMFTPGQLKSSAFSSSSSKAIRAQAAGPASASEPGFTRPFIEFLVNILERRAAPTAVGRASPVPADSVSGEVGAPGVNRGVFCVLVGLDGAGKTTLARNLCELAAEARFTGARYFHWRPKIFRGVEFPLPEFRNLPRKAPAARNPWNAALSAARLAKNVLLANLAWWLRLRPLLRRGQLVLVDRYFYNYYLDPASVKYAGPPSWLERARRRFPRPDAVIVLRAPPEVLLARKQELSEMEILRQAAVLDQIDFGAARIIRADASQPPEPLAREVLTAILKAADENKTVRTSR